MVNEIDHILFVREGVERETSREQEKWKIAITTEERRTKSVYLSAFHRKESLNSAEAAGM